MFAGGKLITPYYSLLVFFRSLFYYSLKFFSPVNIFGIFVMNIYPRVWKKFYESEVNADSLKYLKIRKCLEGNFARRPLREINLNY